MLETIIYFYEIRPSLLVGIFGFIFIAISLITYIIFYIYMNINFRSIAKIIFNDEERFRRPLEPFSFISLSILPTTFWREILSVKYNVSFNKLYGKEFYYSLNEDQLIELLENHKAFFIIQYFVFIVSFLGIIFLVYGYIWDRYF